MVLPQLYHKGFTYTFYTKAIKGRERGQPPSARLFSHDKRQRCGNNPPQMLAETTMGRRKVLCPEKAGETHPPLPYSKSRPYGRLFHIPLGQRRDMAAPHHRTFARSPFVNFGSWIIMPTLASIWDGAGRKKAHNSMASSISQLPAKKTQGFFHR